MFYVAYAHIVKKGPVRETGPLQMFKRTKDYHQENKQKP
jgi:hypothetical protein